MIKIVSVIINVLFAAWFFIVFLIVALTDGKSSDFTIGFMAVMTSAWGIKWLIEDLKK